MKSFELNGTTLLVAEVAGEDIEDLGNAFREAISAEHDKHCNCSQLSFRGCTEEFKAQTRIIMMITLNSLGFIPDNWM